MHKKSTKKTPPKSGHVGKRAASEAAKALRSGSSKGGSTLARKSHQCAK